jgi:hypothetical protein
MLPSCFVQRRQMHKTKKVVLGEEVAKEMVGYFCSF